MAIVLLNICIYKCNKQHKAAFFNAMNKHKQMAVCVSSLKLLSCLSVRSLLNINELSMTCMSMNSL